ncbi:hypothetical protein MAJ_08586, partial [Metarhizium majus ARSEF 297]
MARNSNAAQSVERRTSNRAKEQQSRKGVERDPRPLLKRTKSTQEPPPSNASKPSPPPTSPRAEQITRFLEKARELSSADFLASVEGKFKALFAEYEYLLKKPSLKPAEETWRTRLVRAPGK